MINLKFSIRRHLYKVHAVILNFIEIKYIYILNKKLQKSFIPCRFDSPFRIGESPIYSE